MAVLQTFPAHEKQTSPVTTRQSWWRLALIGTLLSLSIAWNVYFLFTAPPIDTPTSPFVANWLLSFLPYVVACILVLVMKPQVGRLRWIELGLILLGAVALRAILVPVLPDLSHDSWRYLWDARVTLRGYSPYVYAPGDPIFRPIQDFLYSISRFRSVPTIYPPAAQGIYLISYLAAPTNIYMLKSIFVGLDVVSCVALALLLRRKGLDMSRCIIYAWCPLPIIEFAIEGHLDASTITFTILAVLCAGASWRGSRVLTGFLIALATLTKLYPILLLFAVVRRRDWVLLTTCFVTIILAYVPYLILGHGQVLGFFSTYASEQTPNAGLTQFVVLGLENRFVLSSSFDKTFGLTLIYIMDLILLSTVSLGVLRLRWQERISIEAGTFVMIGVIFAVSSHIFPWYTAALLPWVATQIGPVWIPWRELVGKVQIRRFSWRELRAARIPWRKIGSICVIVWRKIGMMWLIFWRSIRAVRIPWRKIGRLRNPWRGMQALWANWKAVRDFCLQWSVLKNVNEGSIATIAAWYFTCYSITGYFSKWGVYYQQVYDVTLLSLGIASAIGLLKHKNSLQIEGYKGRNAFRVKWSVGMIFKILPGRSGKEKS